MRTKFGLELEAALKEALAYARGDPNACKVHYPNDATSTLNESPIKLSKEKRTKRKKK